MPRPTTISALRWLRRAGARRRWRALALKPDYAEAHNNLGNVLTQQDKHDEALASFERALAINPNYAAPHSNSGMTLLAQGRIEQAMTNLRRALALKPDYAGAHFN